MAHAGASRRLGAGHFPLVVHQLAGEEMCGFDPRDPLHWKRWTGNFSELRGGLRRRISAARSFNWSSVRLGDASSNAW